MKPTIKLGAYIRSVRYQKKLSLPEVAKMAGTAKSNLSKIENGKGDPTYSTLIGLAGALGVEVTFGELKN